MNYHPWEKPIVINVVAAQLEEGTSVPEDKKDERVSKETPNEALNKGDFSIE